LNKSKKMTFVLIGLLLTMALSTIASAQDPWDDAGWAFWGLTGVFCIIPLVLFIVWIILAIWVYKDAEKRGSSGVLWLLIVIITGIIGLIIWLVVRPPIGGEKKEPDRRCPNCGRAIPMDAKACSYCAKKFEE